MAKRQKWVLWCIFAVLFLSCRTLATADGNFKTTNSFFDPSDPSRLAYIESSKSHLVNVGRAPFAIASPKFNCDGFIESLDKLDFLHISWLFNTFGSDYKCLKRVLKDPRLITLQVNLVNEPGHRNRRLEPGEFLYNIKSPQEYNRLLLAKDPSLHKRFQKYAAPLQDLLVSRLQPRTQCLINPGLESNISTRAGRVLVKWAREAFPFCKIVWNPLSNTGSPRGTGANFIEQHGWFPNFKTKSCVFNNDGSDINFKQRKSGFAIQHELNPALPKNYLNSGNSLQAALEQYANQCRVVFVWTPEDNCFDFNRQTAPWMPPSKRGCQNGPVNSLVAKEIENVHQKGVRAPQEFKYTQKDELSFQGCSQIRNPHDGFKIGFLLKQSEFSERGGVILTPRPLNKATQITIVHGGKVIDSYAKTAMFGEDSSGRALWRSLKSPLLYPLKVSVRILIDSKTVCYRVNNPRVRND